MRELGFVLQKRSHWCSLFLLLSLLLLAAAWKLAYQDLFDQRVSLSSAYSTYHQQLVAQESRVSVNNSLQSATDDISNIKQQLLFQSEERNSAEMIPFVVKALDEISAKHHVVLQGVKPLAAKIVLMLEERPFDITIRGDYKNLYDWVVEAEKSLSPMAIQSFQLVSRGRGAGIEMRLRVASYRMPGEPQ